MKLYHATPTANVETILREGLKPGALIEVDERRRDRNFVWFAANVAYAATLAARCAGPQVTTLEVESDDLDEADFRTSAVYMFECSQWKFLLPYGIVQDVLRHNAKEQRMLLLNWFLAHADKYKDSWESGLKTTGECAYKSVIPPEKIKVCDRQVQLVEGETDFYKVLNRAFAGLPQVLLQFILERGFPGPWAQHGVQHSLAVRQYAARLASQVEGVDMAVCARFAVLHDIQRRHRTKDPEHGARAAHGLELFRAKIVPDLSTSQFALLHEAIRNHCKGQTHTNPTIAVCWDADRLDRARTASDTNPRFLSTPAARTLAAQTATQPTPALTEHDYLGTCAQPELADAIRARFMLRPSSPHGFSHWNTVWKYATHLSKQVEGADTHVCQLFAVLHDVARQNDHIDPQHGHRAAQWLDEIRAPLLKDLTDEQFFLLRQAVDQHADGYVTKHPTVGVCWDADRLDLVRVDRIPDPPRLSTEAARKFVLHAKI